jgi:6,7-dimethyl-8-ribityllumazine synthase
VQLSTRVPVVFGVLTTESVDQALERSLPDHTNKGREAALTALEMVSVIRQGSLAV